MSTNRRRSGLATSLLFAAMLAVAALGLSCSEKSTGSTRPRILLSRYTWNTSTWHNGPTLVAFVGVRMEDNSNKRFGYFNSQPWLSVTSAGLTTPDSIALNPNSLGLSVGVHTDTVVITADAASNTPVRVIVTLTIGRSITLSSQVLKFTGTKLVDGEQVQPIDVAEGGDSAIAVTASVAGSPSWLQPNPSFATTPYPCSLSVFFNDDSIPAGVTVRNVSFSSSAAQNSPQQVLCSLFVKPWQPQSVQVGLDFGDIRFPAADIGYTVAFTSSVPSGAAGMIFKTTDTGHSWNNNVLFRNFKIDAIDFLDVNTGWAVGDSGKVVKTITGGTSWTEQSIDSVELRDIDMIDADTGWCVGELGRIYHTVDGMNWTRQTSNYSSDIYAVQAINGSVCYATTSTGLFLSTTNGGTTWNSLDFDPLSSSGARSLFFLSATHGWIVSDGGIAYETTDGGTNWSSGDILSNQSLGCVFFINPNVGWIVGSGGKVFGTRDGGANWEEQYLPNNQVSGFLSVTAYDLTHVWVCGAGSAMLYTRSGGR